MVGHMVCRWGWKSERRATPHQGGLLFSPKSVVHLCQQTDGSTYFTENSSELQTDISRNHLGEWERPEVNNFWVVVVGKKLQNASSLTSIFVYKGRSRWSAGNACHVSRGIARGSLSGIYYWRRFAPLVITEDNRSVMTSRFFSLSPWVPYDSCLLCTYSFLLWRGCCVLDTRLRGEISGTFAGRKLVPML